MNAITVIAGRELRSLFLSPLAWTLAAVVFALLAYIMLIQIESYTGWQSRLSAIETPPGVTLMVVSPTLRTAAFILLCLIPLLTMRLVSEEKRNQTMALLLSAPVSAGQIVLGKYLGLMAYLCFLLGLILALCLSLWLGGTLDLGLIASSILGLTLFSFSIASVGLFISTLTRNPVIAGLGAFGLCLLLWILDWSGSQSSASLFSQLSLGPHLDRFLLGTVDTRDLVYFGVFVASFLFLSIRRVAIMATRG